jgi:acyl carrier protein
MATTTTITPEAIWERVRSTLAEFGPELEDITREATFVELDIDSLDLVELGQVVDEEYGIEVKAEEVKDIKTVGEAVDLIFAKAVG